MMKKMLKNQRGLTLIELLAVIVILGIIAAIAVPSIGNIINNSRDKATVSEAVQIINAAKIAKAENNGAEIFVPGTAGNNEVSLDQYLDKVKDTDFEVTYDSTNGYLIKSHDAVEIAGKKGQNNSAATSATEQDLVDYLDGNK